MNTHPSPAKPAPPGGLSTLNSSTEQATKNCVETEPDKDHYPNISRFQLMGRSTLSAIKPAYLFRPATLVRRVWIKFFPPHSPLQIVQLPWGSFIEIDANEVIGAAIFKQRIFDIAVSECAWRLLRAGDQVLDVGANIGYMTSLFAAKVGKQGSVFSFEPHPETRQKLAANVTRFLDHGSVAKIVVYECALGEVNGVADLIETDDFATNRGSAFLADGAPIAHVAARRQVKVQPLDELIPTGEFGLLKIDVEGHELKVIQGARQLLSQKRVRHIIYEDHMQGKSGIPDILTSYGYKIYSIGHTLFGLKLMDLGKEIVLDTSWESPNYLATIDPAYVDSHISNGWEILKGLNGNGN
jgi:FkbM family methyltransferase